jgi:lipoprotein NlpI
VGGRIAYIPGVAVSEQPIAPPATVSPAPAPATAPAAQAANAPPSTPDTPAAAKPSSGNDADVCKTESGSPAADRAAACRRVLNGQLDNDTRQTTLIDLGNALDALGQSEEAMRNYREAVELNPKDSTAYYNIGILHLNQRRYAEARTAFEKAASLAPDDPAPVYQRAVVLGDLGDANSALIAIKRAIAMKADDSSFYDELAVLQLAAGDVADASAAVDKAISIDNGYWSGTAVITYYLAGDREKAGAMIDRGYKEQPSYPYWPIWRALVQKSAGDEAGAQQTLAAGLRIVGTRWPAPLIKFMAGGLSESKLRGFANTGDQRTRSEQLCEVEFYRGELAYLAGDKATAKAAMRAATTARIYYYLEDAAAHARLAQLSQ